MRVACMGRLGRYIGAGSGVVCFRFILSMSLWVPMSGGHILIVNWLTVWWWSWLMVGVFGRFMVGMFHMMMVGRFNGVMVRRLNRLVVGRRPNGSCWFAMVWPGSCLCVQHCFGEWRGVAHTIAVPEVPIIPFSLKAHMY